MRLAFTRKKDSPLQLWVVTRVRLVFTRKGDAFLAGVRTSVEVAITSYARKLSVGIPDHLRKAFNRH